jgi:hypothetical protein
MSGITAITEVSLTLVFSGGWNGDLYAYLARKHPQRPASGDICGFSRDKVASGGFLEEKTSPHEPAID